MKLETAEAERYYHDALTQLKYLIVSPGLQATATELNTLRRIINTLESLNSSSWQVDNEYLDLLKPEEAISHAR